MKRILCIDDDQDMLDCLNFILSDEGYEVKGLLSPDDLFKQIRSFAPNLITLDINLYGENGLEVCRMITSNPFTRDIPVVMISGDDNVYSYVEYGAVGMIAKPFDIEYCVQQINKHLQAKIVPLFPGSDEPEQMQG